MSLRKAYENRDLKEIKAILETITEKPSQCFVDEIEFMHNVVDNETNSNLITEKLKEAIKNNSKDVIIDYLTEVKILKINLEPSFFKYVMEILKKLSEIDYYKNRAYSLKTIESIQLGIDKAKENSKDDNRC